MTALLAQEISTALAAEMFRQTGMRLCSASAEIQKQKMQSLFKLVTGDVQFKNKAPVKDANVVQAFGANWKSELQTYVSQTLTAKSTAAEKAETQAKLDKYLARLNLTRYTSAELAQYLESGAANVDAVAEADQIAQAKAFISANGSGAFDSHVAAEAKNANWSDAQVKAFVQKVKGA